MKKFGPMTEEQCRVIVLVDRFGPLRKEHTEDGDRFFLSNGRRVHPVTARKLIARGSLVPINDGLFGDSQSYVTAP